MVGRVPLAVLACAVAAALLTTPIPASSASPGPAAAKATPARLLSAPAYAGKGRLRARLPVGGFVSYALSPLPAGGVRLLGDWDGHGAQTPGTFVAGQWRLRPSMVRTTGTAPAFTFGRAGDRPVTGDWNGDGITDFGVVRGPEWLLALGPAPADGSSPSVWRNVTLADPTGARGTPVTGDWDGDGSDGIGVFDRGRWTLADPVPGPTGTPVVPRTVWYGRAGDRPVVGDWKGDGTDGLGVVRGDTWYLRRAATSGSATRVLSVSGRRTGDVPLAWRVPAATGTRMCPTRRTATVGRRGWVAPSQVLGRDVTGGVGSTGRLVRSSLEQTERYLLGAQYDARWRATRYRPYLSLLGLRSHDELNIRLPAMSALTVAVGLRTGALDPRVVSRSGRAGGYVDQLVRSIACAHASVSPGGWGDGWETAHWAMLTGAAAWLVWGRLTPQTRADVVAMVTDEADHQLPLAVPFWSAPDDTRLTPGDTKAEEDAWNAGLLALASAMMPSAPHASAWRAKAAELGVAAYSVKADTTSATVVNGVPLDQRVQGYNAFDDGTVVNHDIIHPDYAAAVQLLWLAADFDRLAGRSVPEAMFHDGGLVYSSLSTTVFTAGQTSRAGGLITSPGGTVYKRGTPAIYYPQGDDWGTARRAHFVSLDAHAAVYARYLGATGWPAAEALLEHENAQRRLRLSSGTDDGRTYSVHPATAARQDTYPGREEYAAQNLATAWLALYVGRLGLPPLDRSALGVPVVSARALRAPSVTTLAP